VGGRYYRGEKTEGFTTEAQRTQRKTKRRKKESVKTRGLAGQVC
jgi:hypothetical protein